MNYPTITIEFNRLAYQSRSGLYPLYLRIYFKGKSDYVRIKELPKISKKEWIGNASGALYVRNFKINKRLNEILFEARTWVNEQIIEGKHLSLTTIKAHFVNPRIHQNFNAYAAHYVRTINKDKNEYEKLSYRTIQAYRSFLTKLDDFDPKISFDQINRDLIEKFDRYLAVKHNLRTATRRKHMEKLMTIGNDAHAKGLLVLSPESFHYKVMHLYQVITKNYLMIINA